MTNPPLEARWAIGAVVIIVALFALFKYVPLTEVQRLDKQCQSFGKQYIEDNTDIYTDQDEVAFFYSKRLNTCVMTTENELENEFSILDIQQNYLKDIKSLFWCDRDGVDNVVLKKAEQYNGYLFSVNFSDFLDDGKIGPARAIKTPDEPYSRTDCREAYSDKLREIK